MMKRCNSCGQIVSQKITTCPGCGGDIMDGLRQIDDYLVRAIIHEGHSTMVCKAIKRDATEPVSIRLFTPQSGVNETIARRLESELIELQKLPDEHFVQHYTIKKTQDGLWYRVSEWVNAASWGDVFVSGVLNDQQKIVKLFHSIASILDILHQHDHFMPYLILDDILIPRKKLNDLNVKINYKLSRFLNARATHHGPMMQKLLDCHPDILNQRAIDKKTEIWSLGKVFVELLTANPNITHFSDHIDKIKGIDSELAVLIKIMLSDDPDLRPRSMAQVAATLSTILERLSSISIKQKQSTNHRKPRLLNDVNFLKKATIALILIVTALTAALGMFSWFYFKPTPLLSEKIDRYTGSVAFVMVEYWLKSSDDEIFYKSKVEGTAFLVDSDGYLLTNKHVACPWLEDVALFQAFAQYSLLNKPVSFDFRMFLWFEGEKAFNRLPGLNDSADLSDSYYLETAFTSQGKGNLRIVGVPRSTIKTGERIKSPFKNDFAVLKIDNPPANLVPLPLESALKVAAIHRLAPVIILGFPLGNRTQYDRINTSITRGHVRRSTKEIIQVDSSIYKGNSGGPAINDDGRVIGIASGVITDQGSSFFNINTPLSDFGLILPISRPSELIGSIKAGQPHWNGVLDFSLDAKLKQIKGLALENKFEQARDLSQKMLEKSTDPALLYAAGMLNFCTRDMAKAGYFFKKLSLIEQENTIARLMIYIIEWISGNDKGSPLTKPIFSMTWYQENEFSGYLARVLKDEQPLSNDFLDYENPAEKSWRLFIAALIQEKRKHTARAQALLKESILSANINDWVYFISFSRLLHIASNTTVHPEYPDSHENEMADFQKKALEKRKDAETLINTMAAMIREFESDQTDHDQKVKIYKELIELAPENRTIFGRVAFYHATRGDWEKAIKFIDRYFDRPCRETALSLSLGLLKGELLYLNGSRSDAVNFLNQFIADTKNSWYSIIAKHLLEGKINDSLIKLAGNKPEKLITLHTALGLWAEADENQTIAVHHYREALSSYLDDWNEYDLALGRIMILRKEKEKKTQP